MSKPMNRERRIRAAEATIPAKGRNPFALAMLFRGGRGNCGNAKKKASRQACRGKVRFDG